MNCGQKPNKNPEVKNESPVCSLRPATSAWEAEAGWLAQAGGCRVSKGDSNRKSRRKNPKLGHVWCVPGRARSLEAGREKMGADCSQGTRCIRVG